MPKLEKLTDEMIAKLPEYRNKGIAAGLSTERVDRQSAIVYGKKLMTFLKREHVATVVLPGPIAAWARSTGAMLLACK